MKKAHREYDELLISYTAIFPHDVCVKNSCHHILIVSGFIWFL